MAGLRKSKKQDKMANGEGRVPFRGVKWLRLGEGSKIRRPIRHGGESQAASHKDNNGVHCIDF
jgi:hypothetical protein